MRSRRLLYAKDPYLCGVLNSPKLLSLLRHMSRLTKISLILEEHHGVHGVQWSALSSMWKLPHLREFSAVGLLLSPTVLPTSAHSTAISPLSLFHYERVVSHQYPPTKAEKEIVDLILTRLCDSLAVLTLPTEVVSPMVLSHLDWPRLRELRLRGAQWSTTSEPYTKVFSRMNRLRTLILECTLFELAEPRPFCIPDADDGEEFPWPNLEHLSVSHPLVHDPVYARLPHNLRVLALYSCPHLAERPKIHTTDRTYHFPLMTSSETLEVLRRFRGRGLLELQLEYLADDAESDLLRFISSTFTCIRSLQIYRYRQHNTSDIAVVSVTVNDS